MMCKAALYVRNKNFSEVSNCFGNYGDVLSLIIVSDRRNMISISLNI